MEATSHRSLALVPALTIGLLALGAVSFSSNESPATLLGRVQAAEATERSEITAIDRITYYRRFLKLPAASEDSAMSARALEAAHVELQNLHSSGSNPSGVGAQAKALTMRVTSKGGYLNPMTTLAISQTTGSVSGGAVIDRMMAMPFTALRIIDPQLARVGFGSQCDDTVCAAVVSVRRGLDKSTRLELYEASDADRYWNPNLGPIPPTPGRLISAIEFPPDGGETPGLAYNGGDWPNALEACPDYSTPTGPPIILQLGKGTSNGGPEVSAHSLTRDGQNIAHCLVQQSSFGDPDDPSARKNPVWQYLFAFGAVIVIPREPLVPSSTYAVSITADSTNNSWSFRTGTRP
jgi:hypothetical protein